jgi:hypothetical protein
VKILLIVPLLVMVGSCAQAQKTKQPPKAPVAPYKIPEEAVHQANPVKATPESIAHGKKCMAMTAPCARRSGSASSRQS